MPALRQALTKLGHENMPIVLGGVIPPQDYDEFYTDGALAIFGPGTVIPIAALKVLEILERHRTVPSSRRDGSPESSLPAMESS